MVNILKKELGDVKGLEGRSLEEQFDALELMSLNKPVKRQNKPIVGKPTSQDKKEDVGIVTYKNGDKLQMKFDPVKVFQPWK